MLFKNVTMTDAAIVCGIIGTIMVIAGREIGGSIVLSASLFAFIFFEWYLHSYVPKQEMKAFEMTRDDIIAHNEMFPDDPIPIDDKTIAALHRSKG